MEFFTEVFWIEAFLLLTPLLAATIYYFYNSYQYWTEKGVPILPPRFPLGNANTLLPSSFGIGILTKQFYDELKKNGHRFGGVYLVSEPNLVLVDPAYIKDIMGVDFAHFVDRGFYHNEKADPMSAHLFAIDGIKWKNLRVKLTPTFTSGKMKMMFWTVVECCDSMKKAIEDRVGEDLEIKEFMGRFTTDVIGSCAFGIECNSFKYPDAEFRQMGKKIFKYSLWKCTKAFLMMNLPKLAKQLGLGPNTMEVRNFFTNVIIDNLKLRESGQIERNDFFQILVELKDKSILTVDEIVAQVFLFFIAGFETSSTAMTFALYELARNEEIQKKLRQEICEVLKKYNDKLTYESLNEMKYLGQVLDETLRMYPPLTTLTRRCTKDYTLRDTNVFIEEGTPVLISTLGLHMDPEYYPNPEIFNPERFSEEMKKKRHPWVYLPFGDGPRNCIGLRFGLMQSKIGIATVIKNFKLTVSPITKPIEFDPYVFLLKTVNKVYLRAEKL